MTEIVPEDYYGHKAVPEFHRVKTLSADQMVDILTRVADGEALDKAAIAAGSSYWSLHRQTKVDEAFADALEEAKEIRVGLLEEKAYTLAYEGEEEVLIKGEQVQTRRTYPTASLLQFLLRNWKPGVYTEKSEVRAGALDTAPPIVRNAGDRQKLLDALQKKALRPAQKAIETTASEVEDEDFADLI